MGKTKYPGIYSYETTSGETRFRILFRTDEGRQSSRRGFTSLTRAKRALDDERAKIKTGSYVAPRAGTAVLESLWEIYESTHLPLLAPNTRATRKSTWETWIEARWGQVQVKRITTPALRSWFSELNAKNVSNSTLANIRKVLLPLFNIAVERKQIRDNPASPLPSFAGNHSQRVYLNHTQVRTLIEAAAPDQTWQLILSILAFNGLRIGELAGLQVHDIDFSRDRITISRSVDVLDGKLHINPTKTRKIRTVPIFASYREDLLEQVQNKDAEAWLFPGKDTARPINSDAVRRRLQRLITRIRAQQTRKGIPSRELFPRLTPHDLRHTAASLAVASQATILAVQRMLGHATPTITLDVYADLFDEELDDLAAAVTAASGQAELEPHPEATGDPGNAH